MNAGAHRSGRAATIYFPVKGGRTDDRLAAGQPQMNTDGHRSDGPEAALTFKLIGGAMAVLNELGHGLHEKPYENALKIELELKGHQSTQQPSYPIMYKGTSVGTYIPDLVVDGRVIVDAKVIERITDHERGQMLNYLRITGLKVGLILNFKRAKLEWERIVLT